MKIEIDEKDIPTREEVQAIRFRMQTRFIGEVRVAQIKRLLRKLDRMIAPISDDSVGRETERDDQHVGLQSYIPGLGTVRPCRHCGCLVAGGPTTCILCAREETPEPPGQHAIPTEPGWWERKYAPDSPRHRFVWVWLRGCALYYSTAGHSVVDKVSDDGLWVRKVSGSAPERVLCSHCDRDMGEQSWVYVRDNRIMCRACFDYIVIDRGQSQ